MAEGATVAYVARSDVRLTVLRAVAEHERSGSDLVSALPFSRSGVYKALDELRAHDLVRQTSGDERDEPGNDSETGDNGENGWQVTGCGRLVVDELERHDWLESLLEEREYWLNHDVSVFPGRFRRRLPELRNVTLLRNPDSDPRYLERYWVERMSTYDRLWVGSRIFHGAYGDAMDAQARPDETTDDQARFDETTDDQARPDEATRLITHAPLVDQRPEAIRTHLETRPDDVDQRVCDIPCSFMLTEELFTLSLPLHDGRYDQDSVLIGRDDAALRFGRDFFDFYWAQATPMREYLAALSEE